MIWHPERLDPEWPFELMATDFSLDVSTTALLVIDLQADQIRVDPEAPLARRYPAVVEYWRRRVEEQVIPNTQHLIDWFRNRQASIVFTRNGNVTSTGAQMSGRLRAKLCGDGAPASHRDSPGYQIDPRLGVTEADLVIDKLTSGAFTASFLEHALHNMGVRTLVMVGVLTDACVFGTARAAAELGFNSLICEDACATFTQRAHDEALLMHARIFGRVDTTQGVLRELKSTRRVDTDV